jgi:hypothetical protein
MKVIKFPTRLKVKTGNPILDFYSKCLKLLGYPNQLKNLDVTKFSVNPKDYKKLEKLLASHMKNELKTQYAGITNKRMSIEISYFLLQFAPCERESVPEGSVLVDLNNLYVDDV